MSKSKKRGLRVGHYRITPLGICTIVVLLVAAAAAVAIPMISNMDPTANVESQQIVSSTPTPTATVSASTSPEATATAEPTAVAPTATPKPTATPEPERRSATIRVLGEIMMETDLLKSAYNVADKTFDFSPMFAEIADSIGNADYTIADVEGTLGDTNGFSGKQDEMLTPSAVLSALSNAGVDMLMMANDHALDGGFAELQAGIANVKAAGLDYIGVATSAEEKAAPVVKDINGIKVGFAAYCEKLNVKKVEKEAKEYGINLVTNSNAAADLQNLRTAGAEVVVALINWGEMYNHTPNENQQKIAQILVASGADVILGYNPHAVQPVTWMEVAVDEQTTRRALCLGAPGSFLSNQRKAGTDCGMIFEFTLKEQEDGAIAVESPQYIPTYTLRYENADGAYQYRTVAISDYPAETTGELPEGMAQTDIEYMQKLLTAMQSVVGPEAAIITE